MAKAGLQRFKGMHAKAQGQSERKGYANQFIGLHEESQPAAHGRPSVAGFNSRQNLTNRNCTSLIHCEVGVREKVVRAASLLVCEMQ